MARTRVLSVAVATVVAAALAGCGGDSSPSGGTGPAAVGAIGRLKADANKIFDGGAEAFRRRLGSLRGHPVVVNQWASWCGPCRSEFPIFARVAAKYEGRVGFLGVDSQDVRGAAQEFLERYPVPYPHYYDPETEVARVFRGGRGWPTTAFYDAAGKLAFTHIGEYRSQAQLERDIREHALG